MLEDLIRYNEIELPVERLRADIVFRIFHVGERMEIEFANPLETCGNFHDVQSAGVQLRNEFKASPVHDDTLSIGSLEFQGK